jgi:hypothetical protein
MEHNFSVFVNTNLLRDLATWLCGSTAGRSSSMCSRADTQMNERH